MSSQIITTIAGNGGFGYSGDGVLETATTVSQPSAVSVDQPGNVYHAEMARFRKVTAVTAIKRPGIGADSENQPNPPADISQMSSVAML